MPSSMPMIQELSLYRAALLKQVAANERKLRAFPNEQRAIRSHLNAAVVALDAAMVAREQATKDYKAGRAPSL